MPGLGPIQPYKTYEVQHPSGQVYKVMAPAGADDDEIFAHAERQYPNAGESNNPVEKARGDLMRQWQLGRDIIASKPGGQVANFVADRMVDIPATMLAGMATGGATVPAALGRIGMSGLLQGGKNLAQTGDVQEAAGATGKGLLGSSIAEGLMGIGPAALAKVTGLGGRFGNLFVRSGANRAGGAVPPSPSNVKLQVEGTPMASKTIYGPQGQPVSVVHHPEVEAAAPGQIPKVPVQDILKSTVPRNPATPAGWANLGEATKAAGDVAATEYPKETITGGMMLKDLLTGRGRSKSAYAPAGG